MSTSTRILILAIVIAAAMPAGNIQGATSTDIAGQIIAGDTSAPTPGRFVPVAPCRVVDTRYPAGPFNGPALVRAATRSFVIPDGACNIPATALAYSLNVTVVPHGPLFYITLWPTGAKKPVVSTLNAFQGVVTANAAIVPAGQNGAISVYATNDTDLVLDINGYFDSAAGDSFYAIAPCRVADTRLSPGPLRGPTLANGEIRDFPFLSSTCGFPEVASAYSTNVTAVPAVGYLAYLTTWAAGQAQPHVSTLNSWTGKVVANAAFVPAGNGGATSVYVTNKSDVVLDANGYFAPPDSPGALTFYPVVPCRVADTRAEDGPFGGPEMGPAGTRSFPVMASDCGIPETAVVYSLNVTVVPDGPLSYLTAWAAGLPRPFVSTLNAGDGQVTANAALVPAGAEGAIMIYVTNRTHVSLDINGYFAP